MTARTMLRVLLWLALLPASAAGIAAEEASDEACPHTFDTVPVSVRTILGPFYTGSSTDDGLAGASTQLKALMTEANMCRLMVMAPGNRSANKQRDIMEWQSLNQWLERLTNFVGLNATSHTNVNWRDEYELFAEIYELEI